jgi:hypothetical protein
MTTDFEIENNYALLYQGQLFDLHNNFDLAHFHYDLETKEFRFSWTKTAGDWVKEDEEEKIELIHKSVSYPYSSGTRTKVGVCWMISV